MGKILCPDLTSDILIRGEIGAAVLGLSQKSRRTVQLAAGFAVFAVAVVVSYYSVEEEADQSLKLQDIFLVIDVSTSMQDEAKLTFAKRAATEFVQTLDLNGTSAHQIGLITFSDTSRVVADLTHDSDHLIGQISSLVVEGNTAMGDGILQATDRLQGGRTDASKIIVLLSDGASNVGTNPIDASFFAQNNGATVFSVGYGSGADVLTLSTVAHNTNGQYFAASTGQDLAATFSEIADILISPVSHYSSRAMMLIAIPILLFIPAIEVGLTTMMGRLGDAPVQRNVARQKSCP
ncbi:MAG: VWA domain-containing protein, partial [Alphaproteobacteria bacterium]|nr:VWA domain-containing protein [Alphaproteobacteria bacterium]